MSATETMLLLALRQKNWKVAIEIASQLESKEKSLLFSSVKTAAKKAEKQNEKAIFLLTLWAEVSWKTK